GLYRAVSNVPTTVYFFHHYRQIFNKFRKRYVILYQFKYINFCLRFSYEQEEFWQGTNMGSLEGLESLEDR
ncbi:MAG: hypothetical protein ACRD5H_17810, partial [Nitrososphaerales archaeon]